MYNVTLPLANIFAHVTLLTGRAGSARGNFDGYVCSEDNYPALRLLVPDCITELEGNLRLFLGASNEFTLVAVEDDIVISFSPNTSLRINEAVKGNIASQLRLAVSNMLASLWLNGVDADASLAFGASSTSYLKTLSGLLNQKSLGLGDGDFGTVQQDKDLSDGSSDSSSDYGTAQQDTDLSDGSSDSDGYYTDARLDDCVVRPSGLANIEDVDGIVLTDENGVTLNFKPNKI